MKFIWLDPYLSAEDEEVPCRVKQLHASLKQDCSFASLVRGFAERDAVLADLVVRAEKSTFGQTIDRP